VIIELREWEKRLLPGLALDGPVARGLAADLADRNLLVVRELRAGLELEARSYVGEIRLGTLSIRIVPKLGGASLARLLAHASSPGAPAPSFTPEGLLDRIALLGRGLLLSGLDRRFETRPLRLASPRGQLDTRQLSRGPLLSAALPCLAPVATHDTPLNRAFAAGLVHAQAVRPSPSLAALLDALPPGIPRLSLTPRLIDEARASLTGSTRPARPLLDAFEDLLAADTGTGLLVDMNRFFQALLARLLRDHLTGYTVIEEHPLGDLLRYAPDANPLGRRSPRPRPDLAILYGNQLVSLVDAKYRDLWAESLPREMLYQLAIYALGRGAGGSAIMVYPTDDAAARESRIELRDGGGSWGSHQVLLRPLHLPTLDGLWRSPPGPERAARLSKLAVQLALP
jgi:5-methylcytosine-specific restriction enzyme subunit McrC